MTNEFALSRNILVATGKLDISSSGPSLWKRVVTWLDEQRHYRKTLAELQRMGDRELDDIGLSRHVLREVAREAVRNHDRETY